MVQPTAPPVNEQLVELLLLSDACRRASEADLDPATAVAEGHVHPLVEAELVDVEVDRAVLVGLPRGSGAEMVVKAEDRREGCTDLTEPRPTVDGASPRRTARGKQDAHSVPVRRRVARLVGYPETIADEDLVTFFRLRKTICVGCGNAAARRTASGCRCLPVRGLGEPRLVDVQDAGPDRSARRRPGTGRKGPAPARAGSAGCSATRRRGKCRCSSTSWRRSLPQLRHRLRLAPYPRNPAARCGRTGLLAGPGASGSPRWRAWRASAAGRGSGDAHVDGSPSPRRGRPLTARPPPLPPRHRGCGR